MVATRETTRSAIQAAVPTVDLGQVMLQKAEVLATCWRQRCYQVDATSLTSTALLEGVVEPLIKELGLSLQIPHDMPASAWARTPGLLRLSHGRGAAGINLELGILRQVLDEAASQLRATQAQRRRLHIMLDAAQASALAAFHRMADPESPSPRHRFGGVVVEIA